MNDGYVVSTEIYEEEIRKYISNTLIDTISESPRVHPKTALHEGEFSYVRDRVLYAVLDRKPENKFPFWEKRDLYEFLDEHLRRIASNESEFDAQQLGDQTLCYLGIHRGELLLNRLIRAAPTSGHNLSPYCKFGSSFYRSAASSRFYKSGFQRSLLRSLAVNFEYWVKITARMRLNGFMKRGLVDVQ